MNYLQGRSIRLLSVVLIVATIAGCAGVPADSSGITMHTWRQVTWGPTDAWQGPTSAMYTYVLVGDGAEKGGTFDADRAQAALKKLLLVVEHTNLVSSTDPAFAQRVAARMNQFCVPTKRGTAPDTSVGLDQYDFKTAQSYRQWFQVVTGNEPNLNGVLTGSGPYLVATRVPLARLVNEVQGNRLVDFESPVLIMDLSGRTDASVEYYLAAFKDAVAKTQPGSATLNPMKPVIVQYLTDINRAIPLVAEFWSKSRKLFDQPKKV